jgi:hypothetical protein
MAGSERRNKCPEFATPLHPRQLFGGPNSIGATSAAFLETDHGDYGVQAVWIHEKPIRDSHGSYAIK